MPKSKSTTANAIDLLKADHEKVKKAFLLFKENPQHRSLGTGKIKGQEGIWEGRIDDFYRFTFEYDDSIDLGHQLVPTLMGRSPRPAARSRSASGAFAVRDGRLGVTR